MEDPEDHRIDLEIIFCNFKDKKQNFQNSIQADILDNISKKNYQPGNFGLFEFSSRGSDEIDRWKTSAPMCLRDQYHFYVIVIATR